MKQRNRIYYNAEQRRLIWDRYHSSILGIIHKAGGVRPLEPKRSPLQC